MPVFNFSYAEIKDNEKFAQYVKAAGRLMEEAGVDVVVRGNYATTLRGDDCTPHIAAVFRYPDRATFEAFYASEKYKALVPLRNEACDMTIRLYDE